MNLFDFLSDQRSDVIELTLDHAEVVVRSILIATIIGVGLGLAVYKRPRAAQIVLSIVGVFLTIPSLALFGLLIAPLGLGYRPTVVALVMYALLPIVRNTITGLRGVDRAVLESAQGMGMSARRRLLRIELPLAWPVILTGIRVSTLLALGIAAIANVVNGPGLGDFIFRGVETLALPNGLNRILTGILGVVVLAIAFDLLLYGIRRFTTSRGVR